MIRRGSLVRAQPDPPSSWGISSAGRAPALQAGGRRFDPVILHQITFVSSLTRAIGWLIARVSDSKESFAKSGCCSLTIRRVESELSVETASWRTVPPTTFLIASPRIQLVKRFEERRNAQILKPVLDDASTARRQSYRVK